MRISDAELTGVAFEATTSGIMNKFLHLVEGGSIFGVCKIAGTV